MQALLTSFEAYLQAGSVQAYAAVFALGMGTLLLLAGTFAGFLSSLPRSGRWMEAVRKGFGVFLILVGEYFLVEAGKLLV